MAQYNTVHKAHTMNAILVFIASPFSQTCLPSSDSRFLFAFPEPCARSCSPLFTAEPDLSSSCNRFSFAIAAFSILFSPSRTTIAFFLFMMRLDSLSFPNVLRSSSSVYPSRDGPNLVSKLKHRERTYLPRTKSDILSTSFARRPRLQKPSDHHLASVLEVSLCFSLSPNRLEK